MNKNIKVDIRLKKIKEQYFRNERDTGWINPIPFVCEYLGFKTEATTKEYWIIKDCTDIDHPCDYFNDLQCIAWQKITPFEADKEN